MSWPRRHLAVVVAALAALVICFAFLVMGGPTVARWSVAVCVLIAALIAVTEIPPPEPDLVPHYPSGRRPERRGYPNYVDLHRMVSLSMEERRYCDRVLVPWLHHLATDSHADWNTDSAELNRWLRARISPDSWPLLDTDAAPASGSRNDPPPPDDAALATLIDELENLEQ